MPWWTLAVEGPQHKLVDTKPLWLTTLGQGDVEIAAIWLWSHQDAAFDAHHPPLIAHLVQPLVVHNW